MTAGYRERMTAGYLPGLTREIKSGDIWVGGWGRGWGAGRRKKTQVQTEDLD